MNWYGDSAAPAQVCNKLLPWKQFIKHHNATFWSDQKSVQLLKYQLEDQMCVLLIYSLIDPPSCFMPTDAVWCWIIALVAPPSYCGLSKISAKGQSFGHVKKDMSRTLLGHIVLNLVSMRVSWVRTQDRTLGTFEDMSADIMAVLNDNDTW